MRRDEDRLADILEAIGRIGKYAAHGKEAFSSDELIQTFIIHNLQIIGEAAFKVSVEFKASHPTVPWRQIAGMRHVLVHDYFLVDLDMVWGMVVRDLPGLKDGIESILGLSHS